MIVYSADYEVDIGSHVFPTSKYRLVREALIATGHASSSDFMEPPEATRAELDLAHDAEYLDDLLDLRPTPRVTRSEMPIDAAILRSALLAAGGTLMAARAALARRAPAVVHLGGGFHHAFAAHAEGFCFVNDIAVAIAACRCEGLISRAAVVDLDVHQGNGTAHIFRDDPAVFTLSIHQENNYPHKQRSDLDIGLDDGTGDEPYLAALEGALPAALAGHRPDLLVYVAGADPYRDDQLGGLDLTMDGLERRDRMVLAAAAAHGVPAVVVLAGGYARRVEDTVAIHAATARAALAPAASPPPANA